MVRKSITVIQAVTAARLVADLNPRYTNAARTAAERLCSERYPWRYADGVLWITSHSIPGETYKVTADKCTCDAMGICWHMAARQIVRALHIGGQAVVAPLPLSDVPDDCGDDEQPPCLFVDEQELSEVVKNGRTLYPLCRGCHEPFSLLMPTPYCSACKDRHEMRARLVAMGRA